MRRSWAGSLSSWLVILSLLGCRGSPPPAVPAGEGTAGARLEAQLAQGGWMGRFSRRDPDLAALLAEQPGWGLLRDMELGRAAEAFAASGTAADRLGAARSWLELAEFYAALDGLYLEAEAAYLDGQGQEARESVRVGRGLVALRLRDLTTARSALESPAPEAEVFAWSVGRVALAALEGDTEGARRLWAQVPPPTTAGEDALAQAGCFFWELPCPQGSGGGYAGAVAALRGEDAEGALRALERLEAGAPALFFYPFLQRACAVLAGASAAEASGPEAAFWSGAAREHLGRWGDAARDFQRAAEGGVGASGSSAEAGWLFSPIHGREEAARLALVAEGAARYRAGERAEGLALWRSVLAAGDPGPLVLARLAAEQAEAGASEPLGPPAAAAAEALAAVAAVQGQFQKGDGGAPLQPALYAVRVAAVSRRAARAARATGDRRRAADLLDGAHLKASGYRPGFVNPPGYLAELAREYAAAGEYAPAVAILFSLAGEHPGARVGYESLKRLYASRAGGEAPPR